MTTFSVPDMSCGHCKAAVENAIHAIDAKAQITVDLTAKTVGVADGPGVEAVLAALQTAGYPAQQIA